VLDSRLPSPLPPTAYARFGDTAFFLLLASGLIIAIFRRKPRRLQRPATQN
jgi:hypothetical protein